MRLQDYITDKISKGEYSIENSYIQLRARNFELIVANINAVIALSFSGKVSASVEYVDTDADIDWDDDIIPAPDKTHETFMQPLKLDYNNQASIFETLGKIKIDF